MVFDSSSGREEKKKKRTSIDRYMFNEYYLHFNRLVTHTCTHVYSHQNSRCLL